MQGESNYNSNRSGGAGEDGAGAIGNPGGAIQDAMEASRGSVAAACKAAQERLNETLQGAEGYIQNRPFQAIIYAASVGAVIGLVAGLLLGGSGERSEGSWHRRLW